MVLSDLQFEDEQTIIGLLRKLIALQTGGGGGGPPTGKVLKYTVIVTTIGTTATKIAPAGTLAKLAIVQNISNSTTDTITILTTPGTKGAILNPPGTAGQGGGSLPLSSPNQIDSIDLSQVYGIGTAGTDQVAVIYV